MRAKIVGVFSLKGGSTKTTTTCLLASHLHQKNNKVLVADLDDEQKSFSEFRKIDLAKKLNSELFYPIMDKEYSSTFPKVLNRIKNNHDIIFMDFPGNISQDGIKTCASLFDYIIIPMKMEFGDIDSTKKTINFIRTKLDPIRESIGQKKIILKGLVTNTNMQIIEVQEIYQNLNSILPELDFLKSIMPKSDKIFGSNPSTISLKENTSKSQEVKTFLIEVENDIKNLKINEYE